jgi:flagellar FliL protein
MKKLIIIGAIVLVVLLAGGIGLMLVMKKSASADEEGGDAPAPTAKAEHKKPGELPVFVPLEPFTVNLADKDVDRFAQIGVTLEVVDAHAGDEIKAYLPAIRSNVLVLLSHKASPELLTPDGKEKLADEILREAVRPMGYDLPDEDSAGDTGAKKKKKRAPQALPITKVLFSSFIVQ